jgi:hypothetical protein
LLLVFFSALDHSRKAELNTVVIGGIHRVEVVSGWNLSLGLPSCTSPSSSFSPSSFSLSNAAFRPIHIVAPSMAPVVEVLVGSAVLFQQWNNVKSFARNIHQFFDICRTSNIG